jgi:hypothetical protein
VSGGRGNRREPKRLFDEGGRVAAFVAAANRGLAATAAEEARAWAALEEVGARRGGRRRSALRLAIGAGAGALAVAVAGAWLLGPALRDGGLGGGGAGVAGRPGAPPGIERVATGAGTGPVPGEPIVVPAPAPAPPPAFSPAEQSPAPSPIRPGRSVLAYGVRARLSTHGKAAALPAVPTRASLVLERGTLEIDADARPATTDAEGAPSRVEVRVASYRVEGTSGRFSVSAQRSGVDLVVHGGEVSVWSSTRLVARVAAGERWTNLRPPPAAARPAAAATAGSSPAEAPEAEVEAAAPTEREGADCLALARRGSTDQALGCFERQSLEGGLSGELALIELARIRRDVKGDLAGAERALGDYRRRFPGGSLAAEAGVSRVELLLRLGRPVEALADAERQPPGEGTFWRGVCLAKLGRRQEALRAFDDYLGRPSGRRRAEAVRRRNELASSVGGSVGP